MIDSSNINDKLSEIQEMPVFYPTEEEFKSPIDFIDQLFSKNKGVEYGCVKIVPPASFKPGFYFDINSEQKLPTRYQVLHKLA